MEIWDLYNEKRELIHQDHIRGEIIPDNCYHLVVHVWIHNSKGKYLISKRSSNRPTFPLMWECVGGSVLKGEDSLTGAIRETKEEVGISLSPENGKIIFSSIRGTINGQKFNDILDVWLFDYDGDVSLEKATTDEVEQVKWLSKSEISSLVAAGKFVPSLKYFLDNNLI